MNFDRVFVSTAWRAKSTIQPALEADRRLFKSVIYDERLEECCGSGDDTRKEDVERMADVIRSFLKGSASPVTILIVAHQRSGAVLLKHLTGKDIRPSNAHLMHFEVASDLSGRTWQSEDVTPAAPDDGLSQPAEQETPVTDVPPLQIPPAPGDQSSGEPASPTVSAPIEGGAGDKLSAELLETSRWQNGYCAKLVVRNLGETQVSDWHVVLVLGNAKVDKTWGLSELNTTGMVDVRPSENWNKVLNPGASLDSQGLCVSLPEGDSSSLVKIQVVSPL